LEVDEGNGASGAVAVKKEPTRQRIENVSEEKPANSERFGTWE